MEQRIDEKKQVPWYFRMYVFVVAILCVGPLALPLLWFNPGYGLKKKAIISVVVVILSYLLAVLFAKSVQSIIEYYKLMF